MASAHREQHIRESVPCPLCGAPLTQACRAGTRPHDGRWGRTEDLRPQLNRCHDERREAWQLWKRAQEQATGAALAALRPPPADARPAPLARAAICRRRRARPAHVGRGLARPRAHRYAHIGRGHMDVVCEHGWAPDWRGQPQTMRAGIVQFRHSNRPEAGSISYGDVPDL